VVVDDTGHTLALERGYKSPTGGEIGQNWLGKVAALYPDADGTIVKNILLELDNLNHGIALHGAYLYASSDSTVYRWLYTHGQTDKITAAPEIVVKNINSLGQGGASRGHSTRTILFDCNDLLYISIGSLKNLDFDHTRAYVARFDISTIPSGGLNWLTERFDGDGTPAFASGLRNEVGMAVDKHCYLWGFQTGSDNLCRGTSCPDSDSPYPDATTPVLSSLGGDIHNDNPAEVLHRFPANSLAVNDKFYGYPYCWYEYDIPTYGLGKGTLWAWPGYGKTDEWCRENVEEWEQVVIAHSTPLGMTFFDALKPIASTCIGSFPASMDGSLFAAYHGSW
jgi:glucose/arabinose dehydrogenase